MYPATHAAETPDTLAVVMAGGGPQLSYRELEEWSNQLTQLFRHLGLQPDDRIALVLENRPELIVAYVAAHRAGLYYTPINPRLTQAEIEHIIRDSGATLVISDTATRGVLEETADRVPAVEHWLMVDAEEGDATSRNLQDELRPMPTTRIADEATGAAMMYTSGTTGRAKGIWRPRSTKHPREITFSDRLLAELFQFRPAMTYLSPAPLHHAAPWGGINAALKLGATSIVMRRFDPEEALHLIAEHRVTHVQLVPTMMSRILALPDEVIDAHDLSSLEAIVHSAAPCPPDVKRAFIHRFGPVVHEYYAGSEGVGFTAVDTAEWLAHPGTVGRPVHCTVTILDDEQRPVANGVVGNIWFTGPSGFTYLNDPTKTSTHWDQAKERCTLGDLGHVDDEGYLYLSERRTDLIIRGGVNIYPQEIENVLLGHPAVEDVAVVGEPDNDMGERIVAVVQAADIATVAEMAFKDELMKFAAERLAGFKIPSVFEVTNSLPRTDTGKLLRRLVRDARQKPLNDDEPVLSSVALPDVENGVG